MKHYSRTLPLGWRRLALLAFVSICLALGLQAQTFSGRVTNKKGEAIEAAAFYIVELQTGFVADSRGEFRTTLPQGEYHCEVSSLGYKKKNLVLDIPHEGLTLDVVLDEQVYNLAEVQVTAGKKEDPAYAIIRSVIAKSPYYANQPDTFLAEAYVKGTFRPQDVPAIFKSSNEVRQNLDSWKSKVEVYEKASEVSYHAPNYWNEKIKAYSSSVSDALLAAIKMTTTLENFYDGTILGCVSPIGREAFAYYRFRLENTFAENNRLVYKIKVTPKTDIASAGAMSGYVYIVDSLWCLDAASLSYVNEMVSFDIEAHFNEVRPGMYMLTSQKIVPHISLLGFKAEGSLLVSVKYKHIGLAQSALANVAANLPKAPAAEMSEKKRKTLAQIEKINSKEALTTKDTYKLYRLTNRLLYEEKKEKQVGEKTGRYDLTAAQGAYNSRLDTAGVRIDSTFWSRVRTVPLNPEEREGYLQKKKMLNDTTNADEPKFDMENLSKGIWGTFLFGDKKYFRKKKVWISIPPITSVIQNYNFVDGLWVGARFGFGIRLSEKSELTVYPSAYYTTARKAAVYRGRAVLKYAPMRQGKLVLDGGRKSSDYNTETGESDVMEYLSTAAFGQNNVKFYDRAFATLSNEVDVANGLKLFLSASWERRRNLENHVSKSWFGKTGESNTPHNDEFVPMPRHEALRASVGFSYTPAYYYYILKGKKVYTHSLYPTISARYTKAFDWKSGSPAYHRIDVDIHQKIKAGFAQRINWRVGGGMFLGQRNMQFADFKHFPTTDFPLTERTFDYGFSLLDNYQFSSSSRWAEGNISWYTPCLLLKFIPFLRRRNMDEALHGRVLAIQEHKPYTEVGYSIGLYSLLRVGVFASFVGKRYDSFGVNVSVPAVDKLLSR